MSGAVRRWSLLIAGAVCGGMALLQLASALAGTPGGGVAQPQYGPEAHALIDRGRDLFVDECSSCHGLDARGVSGQGPSLEGAGAASADFYLRTGRMPLDAPGEQPLRSEPRYSEAQIQALDAYVGSLGGPPIPSVDPSRGSLSEGLDEFQASCAGCHAISGRGGVVIGAYAPPLDSATATQVAEAVRVGPYVMPPFGPRQIDDHGLDSLARYVQLVQHPDDRGGWGIGNVGPIPEGLVAWALAAVALLLIARAIGERGLP